MNNNGCRSLAMDKERNMNNEDKWIPVYESLPAFFLAVTLYSDYKTAP